MTAGSASSAQRPIQIAVVGHTNAGKTSLVRTLIRQAGFGEVSDRPGTTRHVERIALVVDGMEAVWFYDTPGLEDAVGLLDYLESLDPELTRLGRVQAFLAGPEATRSFEQEAKVLRTLAEMDAALVVIDSREPVLPKFRCELEILAACAKPLMPVLNFVRDPASREAEWQALLSATGLHAQVRFDAVAPFVGSQQHLYQDLGTLLPRLRAPLLQVVAYLDREAQERASAAYRVVADTLVNLAALRRDIDTEAFADAAQRKAFVLAFQQLARERVRAGTQELLQVYGFRADEAELADLPWLDGRWESDLFNPETLRQAGKRLGQGATIGASIGVVADLAVGGISLGAGAALGGLLGGMLTQGWSQFGRRLWNQARGVQALSVENELLLLAAEGFLELIAALEQRGHAAQDKLQIAPTAPTSASAPGSAFEPLAAPSPGPRSSAAAQQGLRACVRALEPARSHDSWSRRPGRGASSSSAARAALVAEVAGLLAAQRGPQ
ncbi:GTPase/DUF3482 domain-containing protein [Variovorax sp. HJSM1_2]|uniref:GTPase/DUF3482 domain-containing protein n=1 Tax=Variovorax sp. HJSM1_2 TaxID=3366263 RepID=UPI003BCC26ED